MIKILLVCTLGLILSGCSTKMINYIEEHQVPGQHEKAMEFLGNGGGTLVYKASPKALQCLKDKRTEREYWLMQDELDCADNLIKG